MGDVYSIENLLTYKWEDYHVKLLREFKYDDVNVIPSEVAKQDNELFDIETIITHRFIGRKKALSNLQLYMKFEDESTPEWREWDKTYGGHEKVHEYFRQNNMAPHGHLSFFLSSGARTLLEHGVFFYTMLYVVLSRHPPCIGGRE